MSELSRSRYALLYGPTACDRIRLADTALTIEVEQDLAGGAGGTMDTGFTRGAEFTRGTAGDEAVFARGQVPRESMGQAAATRAEGTPDLVITGAVILDHWG